MKNMNTTEVRTLDPVKYALAQAQRRCRRCPRLRFCTIHPVNCIKPF